MEIHDVIIVGRTDPDFRALGVSDSALPSEQSSWGGKLRLDERTGRASFFRPARMGRGREFPVKSGELGKRKESG